MGIHASHTGDEVQRSKPDAAVYEKAALALGVQPNECVCVESSTTGLQAALRWRVRLSLLCSIMIKG